MRRKPAPRAETTPRRRRTPEVPEVPTYQPATPVAAEPPAADTQEADDEAVRRMVEAAYT